MTGAARPLCTRRCQQAISGSRRSVGPSQATDGLAVAVSRAAWRELRDRLRAVPES